MRSTRHLSLTYMTNTFIVTITTIFKAHHRCLVCQYVSYRLQNFMQKLLLNGEQFTSTGGYLALNESARTPHQVMTSTLSSLLAVLPLWIFNCYTYIWHTWLTNSDLHEWKCGVGIHLFVVFCFTRAQLTYETYHMLDVVLVTLKAKNANVDVWF